MVLYYVKNNGGFQWIFKTDRRSHKKDGKEKNEKTCKIYNILRDDRHIEILDEYDGVQPGTLVHEFSYVSMYRTIGDGSFKLFRISPIHYIMIGAEIIEFDVIDEIIEFYSGVSGSDINYPYARSKQWCYLLHENVKVPWYYNRNPYDFYYSLTLNVLTKIGRGQYLTEIYDHSIADLYKEKYGFITEKIM
jgi:hypothetical protein